MFLDICENEIDISQFCSFIILVVTIIYGLMNIGNNILNILLMIYGHSVGIWRSISEEKNTLFSAFCRIIFSVVAVIEKCRFPGTIQPFTGMS